MKRALQIVLVPIAAAIVFIEQTIIRYLNMVTAAIAAWPPIARLEAWLVRLPPYWALLTFAAPSILILPVKLSAFWFGMHHQYGLALGSVMLGKLLGTAILARLYRILRPSLMTHPVVRLGRHQVLRLARPGLRLREVAAGLAEGAGDGAGRACPDGGIGFRPVRALGFAP